MSTIQRTGLALLVLVAIGLGVTQVILAHAPQDPPPVTPQTAQPDGSLVHVVQPGETLSGIALAYHVSMDQIRQLNNFPANSKGIVVIGQKLLIRPAFTPTAANVTVVVITATNTPGGATVPAPVPQGTAGATSGITIQVVTATTTLAVGTTSPAIIATAAATSTPPPTATVVPLDQKGSLCIVAFEDANTNHWQDGGENLLAGVSLTLASTSGEAQKLATTADSPVCFNDLTAGTYTVAAAPSADYGLTTPGQLQVEVKSGSRLALSFGAAKGYQSAQAGNAVTVEPAATPAGADASKTTSLRSVLLSNSGVIVLGIAALVLVGGISIMVLARRR